MNLRGLKQASRQCLRDSRVSPWKLSLLYALCYFGSVLICDAVVYLLNRQMQSATGLSAMVAQGRLEFAAFLVDIVLLLAIILWSAGYSWFALQLSRGQATSFGSFLKGFQTFSRVILLYLLQAFYVWCWSLLFVIPGIVAFYRYRMAIYVLLDQPGTSVLEAVQVSKRLTYGHKMELFLMDMSFLWCHLPVYVTLYLPAVLQWGILPVAVGTVGLLVAYGISILVPFVFSVLAMPYVATTEAHAYNWLVSLDRARREEAWGSSQGPHTAW